MKFFKKKPKDRVVNYDRDSGGIFTIPGTFDPITSDAMSGRTVARLGDKATSRGMFMFEGTANEDGLRRLTGWSNMTFNPGVEDWVVIPMLSGRDMVVEIVSITFMGNGQFFAWGADVGYVPDGLEYTIREFENPFAELAAKYPNSVTSY